MSLSPLRWQDKIKTIEHASNSDTFSISCYFNISHSLTCPKTWEKGLKRLKIPKNDHFLSVQALHPADPDQNYIQILDQLHPNKKGQDILKRNFRRFINDCKVWCFSRGDDIVTQNRNIQLNASQSTGNASSSSLLISSNNSGKDP